MSKLVTRTKTVEAQSLEHKKLDIGVVGKVFGNGENISKNIGGIVVLFLMIAIVLIIAFAEKSKVDTSVTYLIPILTATIGYLFGKK